MHFVLLTLKHTHTPAGLSSSNMGTHHVPLRQITEKGEEDKGWDLGGHNL